VDGNEHPLARIERATRDTGVSSTILQNVSTQTIAARVLFGSRLPGHDFPGHDFPGHDFPGHERVTNSGCHCPAVGSHRNTVLDVPDAHHASVVRWGVSWAVAGANLGLDLHLGSFQLAHEV